jgi:CRP/FNR family transcriptional regulator, cyclic AMP receptor protein
MPRKPLSLDIATLRRLEAFPWASEDQLERLVSSMTLRQVKRHNRLFSEGTPSGSLFLLVLGVVKLSVQSQGGEEVLVSLIRPGELFGITALLPGMQRAFRAEAFIDCQVGVIDAEDFVTALLGIEIRDFRFVMESTVSRWVDLLQRYSHFQALNQRQKLAMALLEIAQKFGIQDSRGTVLSLPLTHNGLADLVGSSRPKVSEYMKEFEQQQLILRDGRRLIVRPERLREVVNVGLVQS